MKKKADLSINMVVMAALAIIVLLILIFVFKGQINGASNSFFDISKWAHGSARGEVCKSIASSGRVCASSSPDDENGLKYRELPNPSCSSKQINDLAEKNTAKPYACNGWSDCDNKCYEPI